MWEWFNSFWETKPIEKEPSEFEKKLLFAKTHLKPISKQIEKQENKPEFKLIMEQLRPTTTKNAIVIVELPSPLFLELMLKCQERRCRLNL